MCTLIAAVLCCDGICCAFAGDHQHHEHLVRSLVTNRVRPVPTSEPPRIERTCGSPGPRIRRSIGDIRTCVRFGHDGPRTIFAAHLRKRSPQRTCCDVSTPRVKLRTGSIRPLARGCRPSPRYGRGIPPRPRYSLPRMYACGSQARARAGRDVAPPRIRAIRCRENALSRSGPSLVPGIPDEDSTRLHKRPRSVSPTRFNVPPVPEMGPTGNVFILSRPRT